MLILALGFWTAASVLLLALLTVLAWFEERHPRVLDWVLSPIHENDLDQEWEMELGT